MITTIYYHELVVMSIVTTDFLKKDFEEISSKSLIRLFLNFNQVFGVG